MRINARSNFEWHVIKRMHESRGGRYCICLKPYGKWRKCTQRSLLCVHAQLTSRCWFNNVFSSSINHKMQYTQADTICRCIRCGYRGVQLGRAGGSDSASAVLRNYPCIQVRPIVAFTGFNHCTHDASLDVQPCILKMTRARCRPSPRTGCTNLALQLI